MCERKNLSSFSWHHFEYFLNSLDKNSILVFMRTSKIRNLSLLCNESYWYFFFSTFWCWQVAPEVLLNNIRIFLWEIHTFHHEYFHSTMWNCPSFQLSQWRSFKFSVRSCNICRLFKFKLVKIMLIL